MPLRIHMISVGSTGDVQPLIALGKELQMRGHQVSILAFEELKNLVESAGISFVTLPGNAGQYISALLQPGKNPLGALKRFEECLQPVYPLLMQQIYDFCQSADAVMTTFFGRIAYSCAEKLNIPVFQVLFFPIDPTRRHSVSVIPPLHLGPMVNRMSYWLMYGMISRVEKRYVCPFLKKHGMRPYRFRLSPDYQFGRRTIPVLYAISPHLYARPADWPSNIHLTGFWNVRQSTDYQPSESLAAFLKGGDTPIYVGFGSMTGGNPEFLVKALVSAAKALHLRVIFSCGWSALKDLSLPENIHVLKEFVPHDWLFRQVRAAVHHGGAGTTAAALRADLPSLIIPFGGDQHFWGKQIHSLGCGPKALPRSHVNAKRLTASLSALLHTPSFAQNAKKIGRLLRAENGAVQAADLIEKELQGFSVNPSSTGQ